MVKIITINFYQILLLSLHVLNIINNYNHIYFMGEMRLFLKNYQSSHFLINFLLIQIFPLLLNLHQFLTNWFI